MFEVGLVRTYPLMLICSVSEIHFMLVGSLWPVELGISCSRSFIVNDLIPLNALDLSPRPSH